MSQSVGTGITCIRVPEVLTPGQVYKLPEWPVINTGNSEACFTVKADPETKLLNFSPEEFCLEAGKVQQVAVDLTVPLKEPQGKRDFILEAQQQLDNAVLQTSGAQVGAAVGTKLTFEIGQSPGILGATMQRFNSLYKYNFGTLTLVGVVICLFGALVFFKRAFAFDIRLKR